MENLETLTQKVDHIYNEMFFTALSLEKITQLLEEQNKIMRAYLEAKGVKIEDGVKLDMTEAFELLLPLK